MGKVIQMAGWKDNLMKRRRAKVKEPYVVEHDSVYDTMVKIADMLKEADLLTIQLYSGQLGTVNLRENAAIKSFQLVEDAHKLAKTVGIVINKKPDGSWIYGYPSIKVSQSTPKQDGPR